LLHLQKKGTSLRSVVATSKIKGALLMGSLRRVVLKHTHILWY